MGNWKIENVTLRQARINSGAPLLGLAKSIYCIKFEI